MMVLEDPLGSGGQPGMDVHVHVIEDVHMYRICMGLFVYTRVCACVRVCACKCNSCT